MRAPYARNHERFRAAYMRECRLTGLFTFPLMIGWMVTVLPFVRELLGTKWIAVTWLLLVFAPLGAAQSIYTTVGVIYNTQGRPGLLFRWTMFASPMYVLSFVVGLRWGIIGVASCYAIVWTLLMVPSFLIPFRLVGLSGKSYLLNLWPTIWMSFVMALVSSLWLTGLRMLGVQNAAIALISTAVVGAALYLALLFWRRPPVLAELQNVLQGSSNPLASGLAHFLTSPSPTLPSPAG